MTRIDRLMAEILLLQERGRKGEEIAELLEVSKRTVIRDMQALCEMGVPILSREGAGGGYELAGEYTISPPQLTWREAALMMLALSGLSKLSDAPFSNERASLQAKLRALLPARQQALVEEMLSKVALEVPKRKQMSPQLESLLLHVGTGQWLTLTYASADGDASLTVRPERIYSAHGLWYLEAATRQERRTLRVDRITAMEPCPPPDGNDPEDVPYDHPSHPLVSVRLSARGIREVERDHHLGQHVVGATPPLTLTFRCPPSELAWYARYFGAMGAEAIVTSPPELIERILAGASDLLSLYRPADA